MRVLGTGNRAAVLLSLFLVCFVALVLNTVLLLGLGHRVHVSFRPLGLAAGIVIAGVAGEVAARIWRLPVANIEAGEVLLLTCTVVVVLVRRRWNPFGQVFFGSFLAAALTYLAFAVEITFASGLSPAGTFASALLLLLELAALSLSASFTFEGL
ncbi:MAG TPA: hypothetical protein VE976_05330, partial [Actinomycetota bacterium]|nr:hypothetical protein [Actinomycetota bacterium]